MAAVVYRQESKEFQIKIDLAALPADDRQTAANDRGIFATVAAVLETVSGRALGGSGRGTVPWQREGIRYDTAGRRLKTEHRLTLAIEATAERTKFKCKQHDFIPELLFRKVRRATVYPDPARAIDRRAKIKLEQDLHFDNLKYCASGSLFRPGRITAIETLAGISRLFPGLSGLLPAKTPLLPVSHWDETVFDGFTVHWQGHEFGDWMLVLRRQRGSGALLEAELSFKLEQALGARWKRGRLRRADRLYRHLYEQPLFLRLPPIFTYADPVASIDIAPVTQS